MVQRKLDIGIAGAGIGGLAAASLLARDGHKVTVFDQFDAPAPVGSGLVIQPVGLEVLGACQASEAALASGAQITRMDGVEVEHGRVVLDVSYVRKGGGFGLAIHRASLFEALLTAADAAGVTLVQGASVTGSVLESAKRRLTLGTVSSNPFDLVIDACGASSPLSPLMGHALPYGAIWATVPWPKDTPLPSDRLTQRYYRANRMAGVLPIGTLPGGDVPCAAIFWSLPCEELEAWPNGDFAAWAAQATAFWPEFAPFLDETAGASDYTKAAYSHGTLRRPFGPALAHIGDAAHRASPQLGQGANMALLDAYALQAALRGKRVEDALPHYALTRRWHVWIYQAMSAAFTPQYQSGSRWLPVLRDRFLAPLSRTPPVPRILTRLVSGDLVPPVRGVGPFL